MGLAALPFCIGVASAAQPLTSHQMDQITAGFSAVSIADAQGLVGRGGIMLTTTGSLSQVTPLMSASVGEISVTAMKSISSAQSSSVSSSLPTVGLPLN
jgi:tartrate dehydratase beta subunit/fumarate hydratase class I family protein